MNKYEAMFIVRPDLSEEDKKNLFNQIAEAITKNKGEVAKAMVWSERRKLWFVIKKQLEGIYYLVEFTVAPSAIQEIRRNYKLNENILRVLISRVG